MPITSQFYHENGFDPGDLQGFADHTLRTTALEPLPKQDTPGYVYQHGGGCGANVFEIRSFFKYKIKTQYNRDAIILYDTIIVDTFHYTFVKFHV